MNALLDTCVISELRKLVPDKSVLTWFQSCDPDKLYVSALSIGELYYGILLLPEGNKKTDIRIWFDQVVESFSTRLLSINVTVSTIWGSMRCQAREKGVALPVIDGLLAATAEAHRLVLVTRNTKDMAATGVDLFNPWDKSF